jgi:hypothetical protein
MRHRCEKSADHDYKNYGGRGIRVCDRWKDFANFVADIGYRPSQKHSLDRLNNGGNYEPGNCRWATKMEQEHNKRTSRMLTAFGETKCSVLWERDPRCVVTRKGMLKRIERGWPLERAMTTPPQNRRGVKVHSDTSSPPGF